MISKVDHVTVIFFGGYVGEVDQAQANHALHNSKLFIKCNNGYTGM
jgi:hypothetical protein